jgi:hydroxypyruvate isomerase
MQKSHTRREMLARSAAGVVGLSALAGGPLARSAESLAPQDAPAKLKGRIKQSAARWCYQKIAIEDLAREAAAMGLVGLDLVDAKDFPVLKKYNLICTMAYGCGSLTEGINHKESHDKVEKEFLAALPKVKEMGYPNIITFSGNKRGISEEDGIANCAEFLKRVVPVAEREGVNILMEILNSKVNHKDYQFDHMSFGIELVKRVNSPRFRILYDIYHAQIMEGDVIRTIRDAKQYIGHYHTGGNPGRNEIDETQELNYPAITRAIIETGFTGFMAHEFIPKRDPITSLRQAVQLCDV